MGARVATLRSRAAIGVDAPPVTVEVFLSGGLPKFAIVGLPETAVRESKDRVRGALVSSGYEWPQSRITVSLAPADMRKAGGRFDLAIALGILVATRNIRGEAFEDHEYYGELALTGELRPVPGVLPAALKARASGRAVFVPLANGAEASLGGGTVFAAASLLDVAAHLNAAKSLERVRRRHPAPRPSRVPDLADVRGQPRAKRALEIAAAGRHNLLMIGPPGTGKSMLAKRLPGILPEMSESEALETAAIDSVLGLAIDPARWRERPFRAPHHTASAVALVGGGPGPRPGEVSRAHNGVLFLDELPEFNRNVLESLREPLEAGVITISRADRQCDFPARFQLVAAMNPCPCGYQGDEGGDCHCSHDRVAGYRGRISGPLLDRIDLHMEVGRPPWSALRGTGREEPGAAVAARVAAAREKALERSGVANGELSEAALADMARGREDLWKMLDEATARFGLSIRACHRVLKVARTIADLDPASGADDALETRHLAEALSLRVLDRKPAVA